MRSIIFTIIFLLGAFLSLPAVAQDNANSPQSDEQAYIRVAHFSPETSALDVYLDNEASNFTNLEYRTVTDWIAVPSGQHMINLAPSGSSVDDATSVPMEVDLVSNSWTTFAVTGSTEDNTFDVEAIEENFEEMLPGTAYTTFVNAIEGDLNVDFIRDDVDYVPDLFPPGTEDVNWFGILDDTDSFTYRVIDNQNPETTLAELPETKFNENEGHLIAVVGTADANDDTDIEIIWDSTNMAEVAMLRGELESPGTVVQALQADEHLAPIADAIEQAGLTEMLSGEGPYTLFVPADFAIDDIPQDILNDAAMLEDFLESHIVEGDLRSQDVFKAGTLTALNGSQLAIEERGEDGFVNDAQIIDVNIPATNGTIHIINQPLIAESMTSG
jgi:uncharacterized surface protein with fasciclin (FAS1) repeats